jgi:hypothetical protein
MELHVCYFHWCLCLIRKHVRFIITLIGLCLVLTNNICDVLQKKTSFGFYSRSLSLPGFTLRFRLRDLTIFSFLSTSSIIPAMSPLNDSTIQLSFITDFTSCTAIFADARQRGIPPPGCTLPPVKYKFLKRELKLGWRRNAENRPLELGPYNDP